MMPRENKRPVSLEDLLRLKRAERPPAEFWSQFDRELRAKQLAAIVERRPWWRSLPSVFSGFSRYQLPLGATAVLALTVLSVREYRRPVAGSASVEPVAAAVISAPAATVIELVKSAPRVETAGSAAVASLLAETAAQDASLANSAEIQLPQSSSYSGAEVAAESAERELTPTARFIATNLALAKATESGVAQTMLGASRGFETRAVPARTRAIDPLSQMLSPSDARRSRLLTASAVAAVSMNNVQPARTTEVRSRRLSDEQLYDTVSRFGARGNSVLVKF